jgi:Fe-S oxidoreductase
MSSNAHIAKSIIVFLALAIAGAIFLMRLYQHLWVNLQRGRPGEGYGEWGERLKGVLVFVAGQLRLFRLPVPGTAHFFIFWGFVILSPTIIAAIAEGLVAAFEPDFVLPLLGEWGPLALLQDLMAVAVIIAITRAIYVRLVVAPERYEGSHRNQAVRVLGFILTVMLGLLVMNAGRIALEEDPIHAWRPVSTAISGLFTGLEEGTVRLVAEASYWIHLGVVLVFLTETPTGKHFHVVTSIPNILLRRLDPPGRLSQAPTFGDEIGVNKVEGFQRQQMLGYYTCTECGRCQEVCPAYASGLPLSPKRLIMGLRDNMKARGDAFRAVETNGSNGAVLARPLAGEVISEAEIWACSTCYACDQECPLFVERIGPIVDMRRYLVAEGRIEDELQDSLRKLGRYGNSFGKSPRARAKWTRGITPKIKDARKAEVEVLWFVGDYASYSPSVAEITQKTAEVFHKAGLDFGILYEGEQNAGNDVRRIGEEGLFQILLDRNTGSLAKCNYQAIVTTDPHSYNTLKNEYPASINGSRPILHVTELLDQLISSGQLALTRRLNQKVTYQDPCYLGRYNGVYDAPRCVIEATGCELVEMSRHHDRALCCGAGGGRIWMEEGEMKERPSETRIREAVALDGVSTIVVACPKDITMFRDAIKTTGHAGDLVVKDLIELVHEAI